MGIGEDFIDLVGDIASDTVELVGDLAEIAIDGVSEFVDNPIEYTVESIEETAEVLGDFATMGPVGNVVTGLIDTCKDWVTPIRGSVLYTDLLFGYMEHSGIYVGDNEIVELNSNGEIAIVSPSEFISGGTGVHIYVSCCKDIINPLDDPVPVGGEQIAQRALDMVGEMRNYNILFDNCHQFTAGCLTGNFENSNIALWMLKNECRKIINTNCWRFWDVKTI